MSTNNNDGVRVSEKSTGPAKAAAVSTELFLRIETSAHKHVVTRFVPGEGLKPAEAMNTATLLARVPKWVKTGVLVHGVYEAGPTGVALHRQLVGVRPTLWCGTSGWSDTRAGVKTIRRTRAFSPTNYRPLNYELVPAFTKRFPILARLMAAVKQRGNRELSMRMQTLEAKIVIAGAYGECAGRKIKVLPVHDSLICKTAEAEMVKEIVGRHWTERTQIPANLKISGQN